MDREASLRLLLTRMNRSRVRMRVLSDLKVAPPCVCPAVVVVSRAVQAGIVLAAAATNITAAFGK